MMASRGGLAPSHVLTVTLDHVEPRVWRSIQIPVSATLDDLHSILQIVMGWENDHLYNFTAGKRTFSPSDEPWEMLPAEGPDPETMQTQVVEGLKQLAALIEHPGEQPERQAVLSALVAGLEAPQPLIDRMDEDSGMVQVGEVLKRARSKMTYTYDFGDGWDHTIVVERSSVPTDPAQPAICLDGGGACPPEDCGGPWGYKRILAAVENPTDPDYEDEREWLEGWIENFDPNAFDRDAVNRSLAGLVWSLGLA
jgi:hypothetical protein